MKKIKPKIIVILGPTASGKSDLGIKLAKKFNLPTFNKKDSQGVCFIGQLEMKEFLKKYIKPKREKSDCSI
jgi:tRNA U34 2-thiouridine synthase MnmA/TrmU